MSPAIIMPVEMQGSSLHVAAAHKCGGESLPPAWSMPVGTYHHNGCRGIALTELVTMHIRHWARQVLLSGNMLHSVAQHKRCSIVLHLFLAANSAKHMPCYAICHACTVVG